MQSEEFKFHQLPSTAELNTLTPTSYDAHQDRWPDSPFDVQSNSTAWLKDQYDPVQVVPSAWPLQPESWYRSRFYRAVGLIAHILLTLSPIIFLMLAFAALSVDKKPLSHKGHVVLEAAKVAPSLFPIIFAAVVGRLMRTYALWRAERGTSLGLLEQLNGSQNLLAAVQRAFHLSGLGGFGLLIIALWGLSPLGGQSSLRVLDVSRSGTSYQREVAYFNTGNYTDSAFEGASALNYGWATISAIFQACLLAPDKVVSSSTDLWGNVKIPLMQSLPAYNDDAIEQDWLSVPPNDIVYSALSGIMIGGLDVNATANFTMETSYLNLSCSDPRHFVLDFSPANTSDYYAVVRNWTGPLTFHSNTSALLFGDPSPNAAAENMGWSSFTVDTTWNYTDRALRNQSDINIIYLSRNTDDYTISGYNCMLGYTHVEAWINCDGLSCYAAKLRPSRQPHQPPNVTPFNQGFFTLYDTLIRRFPWVTGEQHVAVTSPVDWYIAGSELPYNPSVGSAIYTNVSGTQVSQRFGALLNTFWQNSITLSTLVQPAPINGSLAFANQSYGALSSTADMQIQIDVYDASKLWVSLTIIISFVLTFCGIAGAVLKYISTAPDILGYVSSMTKDNPYFQGPVIGDDDLDGLARARLLRDVVVQIGNVKPWDAKGYIALKSVAEGENKRTTRLGRIPARARFSRMTDIMIE